MFPKIVCLCGSSRFKEAFIEANRKETLEGKIVLSIGMFGHVEGLDMEGPVKKMLDQLHICKVAMSDEVLILNCYDEVCSRCGIRSNIVSRGILQFKYPCKSCECPTTTERPYIGESTARELTYARSLGKVIRFLNPIKE